MSDTPIQHLIKLCDQTVAHLDTSSISKDKEKILDIKNDLNEFKSRVNDLRCFEKKAQKENYCLSLVGLTNVGKSTLTQAILGHAIAPVSNKPTTAVPVEYRYNDSGKWEIDVKSRGAHRKVQNYNSVEEVAQVLGPLVTDDAMAKEIKYVTVKGPFEVLKGGLVLADTPGFGAAVIEGVNDGKQQGLLLSNYLKEHVDEAYFCVAAGDEWTITDIERDFYRDLDVYCSHVLITKWEGTEQEQRKYEARYKCLFPNAEFVFVNALMALNAKKDSDEKKFDESNVQFFIDIIQKHATCEKRCDIVYADLDRAWGDIHMYMKDVRKLDKIPWRPHYLENFLEACSKNPIIQSIGRV